MKITRLLIAAVLLIMSIWIYKHVRHDKSVGLTLPRVQSNRTPASQDLLANRQNATSADRNLKIVGEREAIVGKTSNTVAHFLESTGRVVPYEEIVSLTESDENELLEGYNRLSFTNRWRAIAALSKVGSEKTAVAYIKTLISPEVAIPMNDMLYMDTLMEILNSLGFVGSRSEVAFAFLMRSVDPEAWRIQKKWQCKDCEDAAMNQWLAGYSIKSLSSSGRPEVEEIISQTRDRANVSKIDSIRLSCMVDAAFNYSMSKRLGVEGFRRYSSGHGALMLDDFHNWFHGGEGEKWRRWYLEMREKNGL